MLRWTFGSHKTQVNHSSAEKLSASHNTVIPGVIWLACRHGRDARGWYFMVANCWFMQIYRRNFSNLIFSLIWCLLTMRPTAISLSYIYFVHNMHCLKRYSQVSLLLVKIFRVLTCSSLSKEMSEFFFFYFETAFRGFVLCLYLCRNINNLQRT